MFELNVADLLASYAGDSRELSFEGEVIPGYYTDIIFLKPLNFTIKLIALDDGVEVVFKTLQTEVQFDDKIYPVSISDIARTFKERYDPLVSDDIKFIEKTNIDLRDVIYEEILISIL